MANRVPTYGIVGYGVQGKRRDNILKDLGLERVFIKDYISNLNEGELKEVDYLIIATPTDVHIKSVIDYSHLSENIFLEKPIGTNLPETRDIMRMLQGTGHTVYVGSNFLHIPPIAKTINLAQSRAMNPLRISIDIGIDWRDFPAWRSKGRGCILDIFPHVFLFLWEIGLTDLSVVSSYYVKHQSLGDLEGETFASSLMLNDKVTPVRTDISWENNDPYVRIDLSYPDENIICSMKKSSDGLTVISRDNGLINIESETTDSLRIGRTYSYHMDMQNMMDDMANPRKTQQNIDKYMSMAEIIDSMYGGSDIAKERQVLVVPYHRRVI